MFVPCDLNALLQAYVALAAELLNREGKHLMSPKTPADKAPLKNGTNPWTWLRPRAMLLGDQGVIWPGWLGNRCRINGSYQQTPGTKWTVAFWAARSTDRMDYVGPATRRCLIGWRLMSLLRLGKMVSFNLFCFGHIRITNHVSNWLRVNGAGVPHKWQSPMKCQP